MRGDEYPLSYLSSDWDEFTAVWNKIKQVVTSCIARHAQIPEAWENLKKVAQKKFLLQVHEGKKNHC